MGNPLSPFFWHLCRRRAQINLQSRNFSSYSGKDELSIEQEAERKIGWLLKLLFAGTATAIGYQFFPYMGDNLMQQSVSLLQVKDPLFKRMGASRLARFAIDDERRMKIVEMGGSKELLNMLSTAKDDRTRKAALKTLVALSHSDEALASLHDNGAISIIKSTPNSLEDTEVQIFKSNLMKRFHDMRKETLKNTSEGMLPQQWASPCGNECTHKYAALTQIPWRVFCKKGCNSDCETWEECLEECNQICYKDPVLKDQQWSAYIDRSPGAASYSEECFHACVSGCGFKFDIKPDTVDKVCPNRPPKPPPVEKPSRPQPVEPTDLPDDMPGTSA